MKLKHNRLSWFFAFIIVLIILAWIGQIVVGSGPLLDQWTRKPIETKALSGVYTFFKFMTHFGSRLFLIPFVTLMALCLMVMYRDWLQGIFFGMGTLVAHGLNKLIKYIIQRERPSIIEGVNAEGFSFPSGHAMISLVAYGLLMFFLIRWIQSSKVIFMIQAVTALLVALIGFSRYVINVHYLTDVLAGFVFGFFILFGLLKLYVWTEGTLNINKR